MSSTPRRALNPETWKALVTNVLDVGMAPGTAPIAAGMLVEVARKGATETWVGDWHVEGSE